MKKTNKIKGKIIVLAVVVIAVIAAIAAVSGRRNVKTPTDDAPTKATIAGPYRQETTEEADDFGYTEETEPDENVPENKQTQPSTQESDFVIDEKVSDDGEKAVCVKVNSDKYELYVKNADSNYKLVKSDDFVGIETVSQDFSELFFKTENGLYKTDFDGNVTVISESVRTTVEIEGTSVITYDDMTAYYLGREDNEGLYYYDGKESFLIDGNATDFAGSTEHKYVVYNIFDEEKTGNTYYYAKCAETGILRFPENLWYYDIVIFDDYCIYYTTEEKNYRLEIDSDAYPELVSEIPDMNEY